MRKNLRIAFALVILAVFLYVAVPNVSRIEFAAIRWRPLFLLPAFLLLQVSMTINVLVVGRTFAYLGIPVAFRDAYAAFFLANLGRYLPGRVWQILALGLFAKEKGASMRDSSSLFALNQAIAVGMAVVYVGVLLSFPHNHATEFTLRSLLPLAPFLLALAFPNAFIGLFNAVLARIGRAPIRVRVRYGYMATMAGLFVLNMLFNGIGFICLAKALGMSATDVLFMLSVFPLSYVVGYLALITPGGLGVRESMMTFLLASRYGMEMSSLLAVASLVWFASIEASNGLVALFLKRGSLPRPSAPRPRETGDPGRLKIAVLVDPFSHYAPTLLEATLACPDLAVAAIYLRQHTGKSSKLRTLWRAVQKSGWRFACDRIWSLVRIKLRGPRGAALPGIEELGEKYGVPVIPIRTCNDPRLVAELREMQVDVILSAYYTQIIKPDLLTTPRLGCINVHPALLPEYRGANPIYWALADGRSSTGITIHLLDEDVDTGPIIAQERIDILPEDTHHALYQRASRRGSELLRDVLLKIQENRRIDAHPQPPADAPIYRAPTPESYRRFRGAGRRFV